MNKKMFNQFLCSSLMLPEHREALKCRHAEQLKKEKTRCSCIDEQEYVLWNRLLTAALGQGKELAVHYRDEQGQHLLRGVVIRIVPTRREIFIRVAGAVKRVFLDNIISLEGICESGKIYSGDESC